ncbi:hypothetical protein PMAYCL1PPCAC_11234, partial [Pristionchus mayeri]
VWPMRPHCLLSCLIVVSVAEESLVRLYNHLVANYEREVRPSLAHDLPIEVEFVFSLTQIIDVDERNQIMTSNAWVRQTWIDYKLVWDPRDYGNVTKLHIPYEKIWRPDIILYNNADSQYTKSVMSTDVVVSYLGNVTWASAAIFKSSCPLDVRYYPFDTQSCELKFASWAYDGTKIDLVIKGERDQTPKADGNYMMSTEWELLNIRAESDIEVYSCCPEPYPFILIHIRILRRPMFYVFNLILPCVLISGIALLGFYMPSDSGEKVTLGITSLLSTTVFLMLVAEGMPPTSEALPLIGIYYGVTIFIVSLATAMTVFTLNVHHYGCHGTAVPPKLQVFAFKYLARFLFLKLPPYHSINSHVKHVYEKEHSKDSINYLRGLAPHLTAGISNSPQFLRNKLSNGGSAAMNIGKRMVSFSPNTKRHEEDEETPLTMIDENGISPRNNRRSNSQGGMNLRQPEYSEDLFETEFLKVMRNVHATIERNEMRQVERDRRDATKLEWEQVAMVLDRFLLVVFVVATTTVTFVILYQRQLGIFE